MNNLKGHQKFWLLVLIPLFITSLVYSYKGGFSKVVFHDAAGHELSGLEVTQLLYAGTIFITLAVVLIAYFCISLLPKINKFLDEKF